MDQPAPSPKGHALRQVLRARLPIMVAEAVSVVFAVLVALAVDEWWERRENMELGRRGMAAVAAEMAGNLEELRDGFARTDTILALLDTVIADLRADRIPGDISVNYPVALLSDAAWETAQVTRAVHFVPLETVIRIARVYDLQDFFDRNQERLTEQIGSVGLAEEADLLRVLSELHARYRIVAGFRQALMNSYSCAIARLAGEDPQSLEECEAATSTVEGS